MTFPELKELAYRLRWSLLALLVALALALGINGYGFQRVQLHKTELQNAENDRSQVQTQLTELQQQDANRRQSTQTYAEMLEKRVIGQEPRLEWAEAMQNLVSTQRIPVLEYVIAAQRPYEKTAPAALTTHQVKASQLQLKFQMLHEGDLLALLAAMPQWPAAPIMRRCQIKLEPMQNSDGQAISNLTGECVMDLLSWQPGTAPVEGAPQP